MKHTFDYKGKKKTVEIPDEWLKSQVIGLGMTTAEAVELWLFDHDYVSNAEADALNKKAAGVANVRGENDGKRKPPTRKPDEMKRALIRYLEACVEQFVESGQAPKNVSVANIERLITFSVGDENYELTLSKKRKPKDQ